MIDSREELTFETVLDAPPEKVWRALTIPEYRDRWLQQPDDVKLHLVAVNANSLLTFSWVERDEESLVTIELHPTKDGGTAFRLTHVPVRIPAAANSNDPGTTMVRAA
ncbi:MAG: SRPBCC domain-containing protein [Devosia sp.]|uniref:SRPBCC domain-containing protein n=1 Tax=Devosia sp. TaxID=1871048 RepID=UPI001A0EF458|nr:SRPBCC domain-containing protein [Devosia sp.]MBF0680260.1 SRPBCC domain-containing protein [Devosia sp.]